MRHKLFAFLLLGISFPTFAQGPEIYDRKIKEESKNIFNPHWYIQVQAGASHTLGEARFGKLISPAMNISAGYQFSSIWGVRAGISGWESKGAWVNPEQVYSYNYLQGNIDATLDLSNFFCGYNPNRLFNGYLFAGMGVNCGFNNDEAVMINDAGHHMAYLWRDSKVNIAGRSGLGANVRITKRLHLNLEVNLNVLSDRYNSKKAGNADWQFNALAGFTIKLGKTTRMTEPVYYPVEQSCVPLQPTSCKTQAETQAETEGQQTKLESADVIHQTEPIKVNIFFQINSSEVQAAEMHKINSLVEYLYNHQDATIKVCGYADEETGTRIINERISKQRAVVVRQALIEEGIDDKRIFVDYKGDTVQPYDTNEKNRVCICIAE